MKYTEGTEKGNEVGKDRQGKVRLRHLQRNGSYPRLARALDHHLHLQEELLTLRPLKNASCF